MRFRCALIHGISMARLSCLAGAFAQQPSPAPAHDRGGRRIIKTLAGVRIILVNDPHGQLAQEFGGTGTSATESGRRYVTGDHLASTRLLTTADATVGQMSDYLPFGAEFTQSLETNRIRSGKERDAEMGLDYFGARYLSSAPELSRPWQKAKLGRRTPVLTVRGIGTK